MIQYAPALTGGAISNETFVRIKTSIQNDLYIKVEANPAGPAISAIMEATGGRYGLIVGNAGECMYEALMRGACAVMPGMAMLKPYCDIHNAFAAGNVAQAFDLFNAFLPYIHFIQRNIEQFVAMEKTILVERGIFRYRTCRDPSSYPDSMTEKLLLQYYRLMKENFGF
jgi:dihydrodipicolinate synthase/N-acetylneuraminate lyase